MPQHFSPNCGQMDEAARWITAANKERHQDSMALCRLGQAMLGTKTWNMAQEAFVHCLDLTPGFGPALLGLGQALGYGGRREEALRCLDEALAGTALTQAELASAWLHRGMALGAMERAVEALESFDRALALVPDLAEAHFGRGNALRTLGAPAAALQALEAALALNPSIVPAHLVHGMILSEHQNHRGALESFERALALNPKLADAHFGIGRVWESLGEHGKAGRAYADALRIDERHLPALTGLTNTLTVAKRFNLALDCMERLERLAPGQDYIEGMRVFLTRQICRWEGQPGDIERLAGRIRRGEHASEPFAVLAWSDDPALQRRAAKLYMTKHHPPAGGPPPAPHAGKKLRIGYFSSDYHEHATSYLIAGLLEMHDRAHFEVVGFGFGANTGDAMRRRIEAGCDEFIDIGQLSDAQAAALSRRHNIHIAVDLKGITQGSRPGIFAHRAAPVQVNWLGYPGTLPAPYYDYLVADSVVIPESQRASYAEAIVRLPGSYQVNDSRRRIAPETPGRAAQGLPERGVVFCCFNNHYKISPEIFACWMRILAQVSDSVLWLLAGHEEAQRNLLAEAQRKGIDRERLVFAPVIDASRHLARLQLADLSLETLPYNAHTTAADVLWAGVPHLTCCGESFPARVGASLLTAVGLPDLIAYGLEEYERAAVVLANDAQRLQEIRRRLARNRLQAPLFDTMRFTRNIETAFHTMWEKHRAGLAPEDFQVTEAEWAS